MARITTHENVYQNFISNLKTLQQSNDFDSQVQEILSKPLIEEKLVFNLSKLVQNKEHLLFFEEITKFFNISETPEQFSLLRTQLEKSLRNISGFHLTFQNSVHHDLICHDRDSYVSKNHSILMNGVERYVTNSINYDDLCDLIGALIVCSQQCFPELLNSKNASFICSIISQLKLPVESDLYHLSQISPKSDENFLRLLLTLYVDKLNRTEYVVKVFKILMKPELPNLSLHLLNDLKAKKIAQVLVAKEITCEERDIIIDHFTDKSKELLSQFVTSIGSLWDKITISENLFKSISPYFLQKPRYSDSGIDDLEKFFSYVEVYNLSDKEVLDFVVNQWLQNEKITLYRLLAHHANKGWMPERGKKIIAKVDEIINPDSQETNTWNFYQKQLTHILETECLNDDGFLNSLLLPENHEIFCFVPERVATVVMQRLVIHDVTLLNFVNIFILMSLWSTIPHQKNVGIPFKDNMSEFVDLIKEKFQYNLENAFERYTYQQKLLNWFKKNQLASEDVPLIEEWMKSIRKHATFDGNQVLLHDSARIVCHSNGKMILKDRWSYEMLDENGYLVWKIDRDSDHDGNDQELSFGDHLFILKRKSLNIHNIANGKLVKQLTHVDSTLIKSIQSFRSPLQELFNRWFFITCTDKITKLEYFIFNTETLEFVSDGFDEKFPNDVEGYFKFVGTILKCTEGGFFCHRNSYSFYSITDREFVGGILKTKLDKICSFKNSIAYLKEWSGGSEGLHILSDQIHTIIPLSKKQKKTFEIYHVKQLDDLFTFLIEDYSSCDLLFLDKPEFIQTIIVPDDLRRSNFFPTSDGAVCYRDDELIFLTLNKEIKRQNISPLLRSQLDKNHQFDYQGMMNDHHIFVKKFVRKDDKW